MTSITINTPSTEKIIRATVKELEEIFTVRIEDKNVEVESLKRENSLLKAEVESLHKVIGSVRDLCKEPPDVVKQSMHPFWKSLHDKIKSAKPSWVSRLDSYNVFWVNYDSIDGQRGYRVTCHGDGLLIKHTYLSVSGSSFTAPDYDDAVKIMIDQAYGELKPIIGQELDPWNSLREKIRAVKPSWRFVLTPANAAINYDSIDGERGFQIVTDGSQFIIQPARAGYICNLLMSFTASNEDQAVKKMIDFSHDYEKTNVLKHVVTAEDVKHDKQELDPWKSLCDKIRAVKLLWDLEMTNDTFMVNYESKDGPRGFRLNHLNNNKFLVQPILHGLPVMATFIARDEDHAVRLIVNIADAM